MKRRLRDKGSISLPIELRTPNQKLAWELMEEKDIIFLTGLAGTGKTYLAMAYAIQCILQKRKENIYITRPILESGEKMGFLPGDAAAKCQPYFQPVYEALAKVHGGNEIVKAILSQSVKEVPIAYLRGRNFEDCVAVCDEAQNLTMPNFILYLSRLCRGSKLIFAGDEQQSDIGKNSGFMQVVEKLADIPQVGIVKFGQEDCQRSPLVRIILDRLLPS